MSLESSRPFGSRILEHFQHPRNIGIVKNFNHRYLAQENPWLIRILITMRIEDGLIKEIKFKAKSCVTTVACVSALTEMVQGKAAVEAAAITPAQLSDYLGSVPAEKSYCCQLAVDTLHHALHTPCTINSADNFPKGE